ncbi:DUF1214 domain-containing protein [Aurantimonas sp. Leaf443]|uniref:DUF1214 domain-containing protein n=1 Tax=Aurantimonas sp. Leaf443 TaxID=1736378 RepID=UPI0006F6A9FC|nr:DUF1214 domain-containing protein [Aurantimonas sp. Leaf443]KQT88223.1 hypothetical protein ASG48_01955 [Aurantimonas sp. Leaf443]
MRLAFLVFLTLSIALALGGWTAKLALEESSEIGTVRVGPWNAKPFAGAPGADPYSKAFLSRVGNLTLGIGEGIVFLAERDSAGAELRRECNYRIEGQTPLARVFTLVPYTDDGRLIQPGEGRAGWLLSGDLLRAEDNGFRIALGPQARPGNWLATAGDGGFILALTLYDTPASSASGVASLALPTIQRETCVNG